MRITPLCLIAIILFCGCDRNSPPPKEQQKAQPTCRVKSQKVEAFIDATGTVQPDLEGGAKILSPLAGSVEKIFIHIGDPVRRGTPLASLRSSEVSDAHSGYLSALVQLKQAERSYELNKKLFEIGAVTKNDLLTSEANYGQTKAAIEGLKRKLDVYGSSAAGGIRDTLTVRAPIDGRVVDIQAHIGDRFDTGTPLMTVANTTRSLIVANIYDTDLGKITKGKEVAFTSDVFPKETFKGVVSYVSDVEDPDSKTIKTYIKPLSGLNLFKQNMFMKIRIVAGERLLPVVAKSALVYKEGKFYVRLQKGGQFELSEVNPVRDVSDKLTAVEGVQEGDSIACAAIDMEQP